MSETRNFGQIQAVHIGDTPPDVTTMVWHNPSLGSGRWLAYNYQAAAWVAFAGEYRQAATGGQVVLSHNLGCQYPGTVLAFNGTTPVPCNVVDYTDANTLSIFLGADATVLIRP